MGKPRFLNIPNNSSTQRIRRCSTSLCVVIQWNREPQLAGEIPPVVVITSGKGDDDKTTTTANIGLLARLDFFVVAIDADVGLCNLDLLGLANHINYTTVEALCISKPRYKLPLSFGSKAITWLVDSVPAGFCTHRLLCWL